MSHKCYFTKLDNVRSSKNADKMLRATAQMNDVWVGLDVNDGDTGIFFYPDCVLSENFQDLAKLRRWDDDSQKYISYLKEGRVKAVKLRKERSEGLFVNMSSGEVCELFNLKSIKLEDELPEHDVYKVWKPRVKVPKTSDGITPIKIGEYTTFPKHMNTSQFKAVATSVWKSLENGGVMSVSLKTHGTSSRAGYIKAPRDFNTVERLRIKLFNDFAKNTSKFCKTSTLLTNYIPFNTNLVIKIKKYLNIVKSKIWQKARNYEVSMINKALDTIDEDGQYKYIYGTRNVILTPDKLKGGFHDPSFRNRSNNIRFSLDKDEIVYFEVLGYEGLDSPIMATYKDKPYDYGIINGEFACQVYRVVKSDKDLSVLDMERRCEELKISTVSRLDDLKVFDDFESYEDFINYIKKMLTLSESVKKFSYLNDNGEHVNTKYNHTNEGIVVRIDSISSNKPLLAKWKTFKFAEEEGITFQNITDGGVELNHEQG